MAVIPCVDGLEPRRLFAAVSATFDQGLVFLQSDANAVNLKLTQARQNGRTSIFLSGGPGTTINGQSRIVLRPSQVDSLQVDLRGNGDVLVVSGVDLKGGVRLNSSTDRIILESVRVGGEFRYIASGAQTGSAAGPSTLEIRNSLVLPVARLTGSTARETLVISNSRFQRNFTFNGNGGGDTVSLTASVFARARTITDASLVDSISRRFDFSQGRQGFSVGFANFKRSDRSRLSVETGITNLPSDVGPGKGFLLSGTNPSQTLLTYLTRKLTRSDGIQAGQSYTLDLEITFASNAPSNVGGVGSPGNGVTLVAGASTQAPRVHPNTTTGTLDSTLTLAKGNQTATDLSPVSTIGVDPGVNPPPEVAPFQSVTKTHTHTATVRADAKGNLHLVVGTDSTFAGRTEIYIQSIAFTLTPTTR